MKKIIISTLILLSSITTQVKSVFIRGAIYKNNETGQIIVLLGDLHFKPTNKTKEQREQLISGLKKLDQKTCITLVEDVNSDRVNTENTKYQSTIKFIREDEFKRGVDINNHSPLVMLHQNLIDSKVNAENVECRYMDLHSFDKYNPLISSNITMKDVLNEIKQNIQNVKNQSQEILKYKNNYSEKDFYYMWTYFEEIHQVTSIHLKEYINFLENITQLVPEIKDQKDMRQEHIVAIEMFRQFRDRNRMSNTNFINTNILNSMIRNYDKKIIVICSGLIHAQVIECLIQDVGYKQIGQIGIDEIAPTDYKKSGEVVANPPAPINVTELFDKLSKIKIENTQTKDDQKTHFTTQAPCENCKNLENMPESKESGNTPELKKLEKEKENYDLSPEHSKFLQKVIDILLESKKPVKDIDVKFIYKAIKKANLELETNTDNDKTVTETLINKK
jgi:hypothetical protein